ncbi:hypothetical protein CO174_03375 [Candidatus Uhrbacteria bacterium CG_4_9_14_3_um_filter_50_9]|uniref:N-acetyltransferase domain-containing protein n=1 Tax=Candidatus Uhrbacteria bacterium CG_4_9_14_3_um_filter_50_9 TaxID=1975035 RepID=A0A2M7XBY5_9BACT|nr:MAG: hypothetical protein CO174_03375 [Candidatus Uhrbacteria bacterium CG_4_9_14_3_um_filter_50_9]
MAYDVKRYPISIARNHWDLVAVVRFLNEQGADLLESGPVEQMTEALEQGFLMRPEHAVYLIVDQETRELVYCTFLTRHPTKRGWVGEIDDVLTHQDHRGKGFCRALMNHVVREMRADTYYHMHKLRLISEPHRTGARHIYETLEEGPFVLVEGSDRHYELKL